MVLPFKWNLFRILSHGTIYLICSSNFWVCGWIPMVWPFKWKLFSRTIAWCYLLFGLFKRKFGICCEFFLWPPLGVKRLSSDIFKRNKMLFPLKAQKDKCCFAVAQRVLPSISLLLADFPLNNQRAHWNKCNQSDCKIFSLNTFRLQILLAMGHAIAPFVQPLFPVFMTSLKDEDDEVRSNTIYGLGLLAFYGGDIMLPYPFNCSAILPGLFLVSQPRVTYRSFSLT